MTDRQFATPGRLATGMAGLAALLATLTAPLPARACGPDSDCALGARSYRVALPPAPDGRAIIFFHGYRGSAAAEMRNPGLRSTARDLGAILIAAAARDDDWNIPGSPSEDTARPGEELAYFDALLADAKARFGLDPARTLVAGFSAGGMVVWNLACFRGQSVAGFAPMSGTFWAPLPAACPTGPVDLYQSHGTRDGVVPMAGRPIEDWRQGDVAQAFALMTRTGGYGAPRSDPATGYDCARQTNPAGKVLELCTFPGGHGFRAAFLKRVWQELGLDR